MIEFKGIKENIKNKTVRDILERHYYDMLLNTTGFISLFIEKDLDPQYKIWDDEFIIEMREEICPSFIKDDDERIRLIRSTFYKIYSTELEKLSAEENYVLARALSFGIYNEESAIKKLIELNELKKLEEWLDNYKIKSEGERKIVQSYIYNLYKKPTFYKDYLDKIGGDFKDHIMECKKDVSLIEYENPNSLLLMLFSKDELLLLSAVQPEVQ